MSIDVRRFVRDQIVPIVSVVAALVTCLLVPPDAGYAGYIDWGTLGRLACMLAVVGALREAGLFQMLAVRLVARCRTMRGLAAVLVGVTSFASMLVTNDMALVALLPLAAASLLEAGRRDLIAPVFVLQGLAANLCGMILPFGNPQNIYLSDCYAVGFGPFVQTMVPPFAVSVVLIVLCCVALVRSDRVAKADGEAAVGAGRAGSAAQVASLSAGRLVVLAVLFAVCVAAVLGAVPVPAALAAAVVGLLFVDRKVFVRTDWGLLVTFAAFFVFSGNLARIDAVSETFAAWLAGGAFVPGAVLSQIVSNVPAAVVLSRFTGDWQGLLVGVNVGGAGTPIASLATLIVVTQFQALARAVPAAPSASAEAGGGMGARGPEVADASEEPGRPRSGRLDTGRFMGLLCGLNVAFLVLLLVVGVALGW